MKIIKQEEIMSGLKNEINDAFWEIHKQIRLRNRNLWSKEKTKTIEEVTAKVFGEILIPERMYQRIKSSLIRFGYSIMNEPIPNEPVCNKY